jgi:hypothetical protein
VYVEKGMRNIVALLLGLVSLVAQPAKPDNRWAPLSFLIGDWTGEGGGGPGLGAGGFSFRTDQGGTVLIRKNRADYPVTKNQPAHSHTDLMIVYQEPGESKLQAIYFDSEDHVIHYTVEPSADGGSVQFLSRNHRLTYSKAGSDTVAIRFEIAPADRPEAFKTYIDAKARRTKR